MNKPEKISFDEIIQTFEIPNKESFIKYLTEIWKDLSRRSNETMQGINNLIFSKYYELPGIISDRLFAVFNSSGKGSLTLNDFLKGMSILFSEDFDELTKFIFNFYDFNKDSYITREDVRVVLSYVPVKSRLSPELCLKYEIDGFIDRVEAQDELFELLNKTFEDKVKLSKEEFIDVIYNKCSDAFVFILVFVLENKPFTNQTIQVYQRHSSFSYSLSTINTSSLSLMTKMSQHLIVSPSTMKKLESPTLQFKMQRKEDKENNTSPNPIKLIRTMKGRSPISRNRRRNLEEESNNDFFLLLGDNTTTTHHPQRRNKIELQEDISINNHKHYNRKMSNPLLTEVNVPEEASKSANSDREDIEYEGYTLKICKNNKLKRQWLKLVFKDLYIFKDKNDPTHKSLHNLAGVYINSNPPVIYGEQKYYSFSIIYPKKTRTYFIETENEFNTWVKYLCKASNIEILSESYEIKGVIGKGKFGLVKLGIHKKTKRKVAIKIMNKKDMSPEDFKLAKTEIDILKISQHPNIIQLYDVIESPDAIYIIMEYCSGGDLFAYIEKRHYRLPEKKAAEIIHKLSAVVYFIHSYGIVHRDLKPENILMTDTSETADIRLLDFGLSKIIGPKETCKEPYGTMSYVAPEVLLEKPYDQKVDLWSIGVIAYLLLCGCLPFDDEHSEKEIARKTIVEPVIFHEHLWKNISLEAKNFVNSLLQKNPMKRLTIKQILEHEWIKKYFSKVIEERKNSIDLTSSIFKLYSTVQD